MKAFKKSLMAAGVISLAASLAGPAYAADPLVFIMNQSNNAGFPNLDVAKLTISEIMGGTQWTMEALSSLDSYPDSYIKSLDFSYVPPPDTFSLTNFQVLSGTVGLSSFSMQNENPSVNFSTANNTNRFTGNEIVRWDFAGTNLGQFSGLITHVNAIYNGESVKFSSGIPEPETYAMWLAGLGVVGLLAMRRNKVHSGNPGFAC